MASDRLLKYPRTPHLPFSQGKILRTGSFLNGVLLGGLGCVSVAHLRDDY